ncbi:MAG TPA: cupredoxin domain-containing protein [Actinopolymorphaceae bacterium]|jgi:hypothetical protein|nr:cupredoxin domain-containing protein [Actinopolymorphaceae bacterium]
MFGRRRLIGALAPALVGLALLVAGCGSGSGTAERSGSAPTVKVLHVKIMAGKVSPNAENVKVPKGTKIRIEVTSDAADELHVHGYDKELEVKPGTPGTLTFVADETGRFEIEMHSSDTLVYQLEVTQ